MGRGERLIKLRYSWFSTKAILVVWYVQIILKNGKAIYNLWGVINFTEIIETVNIIYNIDQN